ncbi:hypothetical protein ACROYT_G013932 [Oculina patagonica]
MRRSPTVVDKVTQTPALEKTANQTFTSAAQTTAATCVEDKNVISVLDDASLSEIANNPFLKLTVKNGIDTNPADFASQSIRAMKHLQENGKNNLLYKFQSTGAHFLDFNNIKLALDERPEDLYQCLMTFIEDSDEEMSPTLETI